MRRTLLGTIGELAVRTEQVAVAVEYQDEMLGWLGERARDAFDRAVWNIAVDVRDGTVMHGEVLSRWRDVVGTGELSRSPGARPGDVGRHRRPRKASRGAITSGVETVVLERVAQAIEETVGQWRSQPAGAALLGEWSPEGVV